MRGGRLNISISAIALTLTLALMVTLTILLFITKNTTVLSLLTYTPSIILCAIGGRKGMTITRIGMTLFVATCISLVTIGVVIIVMGARSIPTTLAFPL